MDNIESDKDRTQTPFGNSCIYLKAGGSVSTAVCTQCITYILWRNVISKFIELLLADISSDLLMNWGMWTESPMMHSRVECLAIPGGEVPTKFVYLSVKLELVLNLHTPGFFV